MKEESQSRTWISCAAVAAVIIAAIIGLGMPFAERLADRYFPPPTTAVTPTPVVIVVTATPNPLTLAEPIITSTIELAATSTTQPVTTFVSNPITTESRADALIRYDQINRQNGWCSLWNTLVNDNLVVGNCPQSVAQFDKASDITGPNGNPIYAAQIRIPSEIQINYPACATFTTSDATASDGKIIPGPNFDFIGTNITMEANSFFTLYFRCEETIAP